VQLEKKIMPGSGPNADVVNVELRVFVNEGSCELQIQASGAHRASSEVSLTEAQFSSFTFERLKKKLGSKCPPLKPGGTLSKHPGMLSFTDSQSFGEVGIETDKNNTKIFDIVFHAVL